MQLTSFPFPIEPTTFEFEMYERPEIFKKEVTQSFATYLALEIHKRRFVQDGFFE